MPDPEEEIPNVNEERPIINVTSEELAKEEERKRAEVLRAEEEEEEEKKKKPSPEVPKTEETAEGKTDSNTIPMQENNVGRLEKFRGVEKKLVSDDKSITMTKGTKGWEFDLKPSKGNNKIKISVPRVDEKGAVIIKDDGKPIYDEFTYKKQGILRSKMVLAEAKMATGQDIGKPGYSEAWMNKTPKSKELNNKELKKTNKAISSIRQGNEIDKNIKGEVGKKQLNRIERAETKADVAQVRSKIRQGEAGKEENKSTIGHTATMAYHAASAVLNTVPAAFNKNARSNLNKSLAEMDYNASAVLNKARNAHSNIQEKINKRFDDRRTYRQAPFSKVANTVAKWTTKAAVFAAKSAVIDAPALAVKTAGNAIRKPIGLIKNSAATVYHATGLAYEGTKVATRAIRNVLPGEKIPLDPQGTFNNKAGKLADASKAMVKDAIATTATAITATAIVMSAGLAAPALAGIGAGAAALGAGGGVVASTLGFAGSAAPALGGVGHGLAAAGNGIASGLAATSSVAPAMASGLQAATTTLHTGTAAAIGNTIAPAAHLTATTALGIGTFEAAKVVDEANREGTKVGDRVNANIRNAASRLGEKLNSLGATAATETQSTTSQAVNKAVNKAVDINANAASHSDMSI